MPKSKIEPLKLNLQYFAEETETEESTGDSVEEIAKVELTEDELNKKIEAESDRKLTKSLEKKQKEWEKQFNERVKAERDEADKLAKLSQKERDDVEYQKKIDALTKREEALQKQELRASVVNELNEKKLPASFADFLLGADADKTFENISTFKKTFDESIESAVNERLKGNPPSVGTTNTDTKNPFKPGQINLTEQARMLKEDPARAKQLQAQA